MKITLEDVESWRGPGGGQFNEAQLNLLGLTWREGHLRFEQAKKGWPRRLVGNQISEKTARQLTELAGQSKAQKKRQQRMAAANQEELNL